MSGTSVDAVDAVLVDFSGGTSIVASHSETIPSDIKQDCQSLSTASHNEIKTLGRLDRQLG